MQRYLAHKVIYGGKLHQLAVVTISDEGIASIAPFERETASTAFVDGTIYVVATNVDSNDVAVLTEASEKLKPGDKAKIVVVRS
jgi:hypothetical protein